MRARPMKVARSGGSRGREAATPSAIPARGWKDILLRVKDQLGADNISIVAAGVAFYLFLALFPAVAALVSVVGLVVNPGEIERYVAAAGEVMPPEALAIVASQVQQLASASSRTLGLSLVVSVALALWSATAGTKSLMAALNIAYGEEERRGYLRYYATAILLTLGAIAFAVLALALVAVLPALLALLPVPQIVRTALGLVRWVILAGAFVLGLAVVYRFAPDRTQPQWRWVSWGAAAATALWLLGSALFSLYVANFGDYNKTYGALAAIVILLTWIYLTAFVVLLGAELNAEMEHQTRVDSTTGAPRPMGRRGARVADSVGESR
ncbi:MAG TPA: YihY/virulence factor BrkB family protein [Burkholderiales bacterium]